jgi:hypothetical protein|tara:strand:+ start:1666 stop:2091 length:426 start_codon:yes stop_codon:yes gene_type:complete
VHHSKRKFGEVREDGYRYIGMRFNRLKKDGTYGEDWRSPEGFEKQLQNNKKNKKRIYDYISQSMNNEKLKRGCKHCGRTRWKRAVSLDFHHLNRADKFLSVSRYWRTSLKQFEKMREEWKKCIVLCSNCHREEEERLRNEN